MTVPVESARCGKDRIARGALHFHLCQLVRGQEGLHRCLCSERVQTLLEEAEA